MIEISTEALELNAGRDFLYVQLTKCAEPDTKGCEEDPENYPTLPYTNIIGIGGSTN